MSLFDQVQANTIKNLRIKDTDDEMIDEVNRLIDVLEQNTSIETVHFEDEYLGCIRSDSRNELIEVVGKLPNLHEVIMGNSLVHIRGLTQMLVSSSKNLRVLKLKKLTFQGVDEDFQACEAALLSQMVLKEFEMVDCKAAISGISIKALECAGKKGTSGVDTSAIQVEANAQVA